MKPDKGMVYSLLGLKEPLAFQKDLQFRNAKLLLADFKKRINGPYSIGDTYYNRYDFLWNRQTGKTTDKIIEAILAEYDGKNVVLITNTNVSMARTRHIWGNYRSKVMAVYGDPYYCGGYGRVMTKERAQHYYRGENILIIDDCDF